MRENKKPESKKPIFIFFEYKPLQYLNYKSLNHIWIWDDRDKLWFRYDKSTSELLNVYESIAVQDMPDDEELQKCLINKELENRIIEKINDMIGEKGICYSVSKEDLERQEEKNVLFEDWKKSMDAKENGIDDYIFFTDRLGRKVIINDMTSEKGICYSINPDTLLENRFDYIWIHSVKDSEWWLYSTKNNESKMLKKDFNYECALKKLGTDELSINEKRQIINSIKIIKSKYSKLDSSNIVKIKNNSECNCYNSKKEENMPPTMNKVKVVPKSDKYTRKDIEQALNEAHDGYNYVLDFKKEDDEYVYLYFKERDLQ